MRRISNPVSRFDPTWLDWDEEPPAATLEIFEDSSRTILARNESPDLPFRWSVNPYRGCTHACAYCYARPSHEYLGFGAGTDFDSRIVIKPNAPELLRTELTRPAWKGELIAFSGDTDCYQPIEAHYRLTRRCLEVCRDLANPIGVVSKSYLITRDVDLLRDLAGDGLAAVAISIPFSDDKMARLLEPGAPSPSRRLAAIAQLAAAGIPVDVLIAPIIPGLNEEQIPSILEQAKRAGAGGASATILRLPGATREVFLARLRELLPLRASRVEARIRDVRGGALNDPRFGHRMTGTGPYGEMILRSFEIHRKRLGLIGRHDWRRVGQNRARRKERQPSLFDCEPQALGNDGR